MPLNEGPIQSGSNPFETSNPCGLLSHKCPLEKSRLIFPHHGEFLHRGAPLHRGTLLLHSGPHRQP